MRLAITAAPSPSGTGVLGLRHLTEVYGSAAAVRDLVVISAVALLVLLASHTLDGFEALTRWAAEHEEYEVDELLMLLIVMAFAFAIFAWRRLVDLRRQIARRGESEARMRHMALHDALTGLPNRMALQEALYQAVGGTRRGDALVAVHCLDLDRFKDVNDALARIIHQA